MNSGAVALNQQSAAEVIRRGSKSFYLAGLLLDGSTMRGAFQLYQWCRYCDDEIDETPPDEMNARLEQLTFATRQALEQHASTPLTPPFQALRDVVNRYAIPHRYPFELLQGLRMDAEGRAYTSLEELEVYCYHVAGVVGIMMAHILGTRDPRALEAACAMGQAMQLTNIARDVLTDFHKGRVYLPCDLMTRAGLQPQYVGEMQNRTAVFGVVQILLARADRFYMSGDEGIKYLRFQIGFAIRTARLIYSAIGVRILKKGPGVWRDRVYVGLPSKLVLVVKAFVVSLVKGVVQ